MPGIINILSSLLSPEEAQALMLGPDAEQADLEALERAKAEGLAPIRTAPYASGNWYEEGGRPIFEIDDRNAKLIFEPGKRGDLGTIDTVLDHPELFKNYPSIKDVKVVRGMPKEAPQSSTAMYIPEDRTVYFSPQFNRDEAKSVLIHELQHAVDEDRDTDIYYGPGIFDTSYRLGDEPTLDAINRSGFEKYLLYPTEQRAYTSENRLNAAEAGLPMPTNYLQYDQYVK
jgi:hypothetical protein